MANMLAKYAGIYNRTLIRAATIEIEYLNIPLNISIFKYSRAPTISCE